MPNQEKIDQLIERLNVLMNKQEQFSREIYSLHRELHQLKSEEPKTKPPVAEAEGQEIISDSIIPTKEEKPEPAKVEKVETGMVIEPPKNQSLTE